MLKMVNVRCCLTRQIITLYFTLEATFLTIPAVYPLSRRVVATTGAVVATIDRIVT